MGFQGKNTEVVCHCLLPWTMFVRTIHHDLSVLGGPTGFIELDKAVCGPSVIRLTSFL